MRNSCRALALTLAIMPTGDALGGDFAINWFTIDGGGEIVSTGGDFELVGGFWAFAACDPCDMNCDGTVDALDIEFFIDILFNGVTPCDICTGDTNGDGNIDAADIEGFINCLFP